MGIGSAARCWKVRPRCQAPGARLIAKRIDDLLRKWYAWGPEFELEIGPVKPWPAGHIYEVPVEVTAQGGSDTAVVYVTKDGHYMLRGDLQDLNGDPLGDTMRKLNLQGAASKGPADAKVVLVDLAISNAPAAANSITCCAPSSPNILRCASSSRISRSRRSHPCVRLVSRIFAGDHSIPGPMSTAVTDRCVLAQSSDAFWNYHNSAYDIGSLPGSNGQLVSNKRQTLSA